MKRTGLRICCLLGALLVLLSGPAGTPAADGAGKDGTFRKKALSSSSVDVTKTIKAKKPAERAADSAFIRAAADFSVKLLQETVRNSGERENILVSPQSVLTALTLLENGTAGKTRSEMVRALGGISVKKYTEMLTAMNRRLSADSKLTIRTANSIWIRKKSVSLKKKYLQRAVGQYGASVYSAPFDARTVKDINAWVYNNTRGKISSILSRLEPSSRIVLLNTVYFRGAWGQPFAGTVRRNFTGADGKKKKVEMLSGSRALGAKICGAEGIAKPYEGGTVYFLALLPPKETGLDAFVGKLTGEALTEGFRKALSDRETVKAVMPPFSYDYAASLRETLRGMGMKAVFSDQADLSAMTNSPAGVDDILHKTYIRLDRGGTEAAAVTAIVVKATSVIDRPPERTVCLNRPFVYALMDTETGLPLFIGAVRTVK